MGHRANYVLVEDGAHVVHHSQFGALSIGTDPLMGPDALVEYVRELETRDRLTDEVWCEGAIVIDLDARVLLFYTWHGPLGESLALRRAYFALLGEEWPGWTIRYAALGQEDVVAYLGVDPDGLIEPYEPRWTPLRADDVAGRLLASEGRPHDGWAVTVRFDGGEVRDYLLDGGGPPFLDAGPDVVDALAGLDGFPGLTERAVFGGVFLDVAAREAALWPPLPEEAKHRAADRWPGWTLRWHEGGLPEQAALSGRDPAPFRLSRADLAAEAAELLGMEGREEASWDFLQRHIAEIEAAGSQVVSHAVRPAPRPEPGPRPSVLTRLLLLAE